MDDNKGGPAETRPYRGYQAAGLLMGPGAALVLLLMPVPDGLIEAAWHVAAVAAWMAIWWAAEAIPVAATALLPLILFPLFGVGAFRETAAPFANPLIFLFLGGFLIALAMQRWNLHRRIALHILTRLGEHPHLLVGGFMAATATLSMWVSNTATTMMMLPIAASVIAVETGGGDGRDERNFGLALVLGIAYAASIGGLGTLVGTPPNALLAAFLSESYGIEIGFVEWMLLGLPLVAVFLPLAWLVLTRIVFPFQLTAAEKGRAYLESELAAMGPLTSPEKMVAVVFSAVAILWVMRPLLDDLPGLANLTDPGIALLGGLLLFVIPADASLPWGNDNASGGFLMDWDSARNLPWSVLLLFGGGLSLADAVTRTGLAEWIGQSLAVAGALPPLALVLVVTALVIFLTELTSNTATTAALLPIFAGLAIGLDLPPLALTVPTALAASCAFMLPVATPPNAIAFASGRVTIPQMARAGVGLNLLGIVLITLAARLILPLLFTGS